MLCLNDPVPIQLERSVKDSEWVTEGLASELFSSLYCQTKDFPLPCSDTVHALPTDPRVETGLCTTSSERTGTAYWVSGGAP